VIRTFYRWGRTIDISIYADAACTTPAVVIATREHALGFQRRLEGDTLGAGTL
jgi:hypothetical protein